jgi:hypothetical protein
MTKKRAPSATDEAAAKKLRRTPSEAVAYKACQDNFRNQSDEAIFLERVDGSTTFEDVLEGVRAKKKDKTFPLGATFYRHIRRRRFRESAVSPHLNPPQPAEVVDSTLLRAMKETKKQRPDHSLMINWIGSKAPANTTELIGIVRWGRKLNPKNVRIIKPCLAFVQFIQRIDMRTKYPNQFELVKTFCDRFNLGAWQRANGVRVQVKPTAAAYCKSQYNVLLPVFPKVAFDKVLAANGNWASVRDELQALVGSSDTGLEIWSFALVFCLAITVTKLIADEVVIWATTGQLTVDGLAEAKTTILNKVMDIENVDLLPPLRDVEHNYAGTMIPLQPKMVADEVAIALNFAWRPMAVAQKTLVPLWLDEALNKNPVTVSGRIVHVELAASADFCRQQLNAAFKGKTMCNGSEIAKTLKASRQNFDALDQDFEADVSVICSTSGTSSETKLMAQIASLLPDAANAKDAESVLLAVTALKKQPVYTLASKPAQAKLALVNKILGKIVDAEPPDLTLSASDPALKHVHDKFQFFSRYQKAASAAGAAPPILTGYKALQARLEYIKKCTSTKVAYDKSELNDFNTFSWLIPDLDRKAYADLYKSACTDGKKKIAKVKGKAAGPTSDRALAEAMDMFL